MVQVTNINKFKKLNNLTKNNNKKSIKNNIYINIYYILMYILFTLQIKMMDEDTKVLMEEFRNNTGIANTQNKQFLEKMKFVKDIPIFDMMKNLYTLISKLIDMESKSNQKNKKRTKKNKLV